MSVFVEKEGEQWTRMNIKTTPSMLLKQVAEQAQAKLVPSQSAFSYGLRHNKTMLDLSLSVRFANLPPGAKLVLVTLGPSSTLPPGSSITNTQSSSSYSSSSSPIVSIALQLDDGGRLIDKFPCDTFLWEILRHFELISNGSVNVTRREAVPPTDPQANILQRLTSKRLTPLYQIPVCVLMNKEYSSIEALKQTRLSTTGLVSGSGVIRVLYRFHLSKNLDQMLPELGDIMAPLAAGAKSASSPIIATSAKEFSSSSSPPPPPPPPPPLNRHDSPSAVEGAGMISQVPNNYTTTNIVPQHVTSVASEADVPTVTSSGEASSLTANMNVSYSTNSRPSLSTNEVSASNSPSLAAVRIQDDSPLSTNFPPFTSSVSSSSTNDTRGMNVNNAGSTLALPEIKIVDRNIKLYRPVPQNLIMAQVDLPDSFFELNAGELSLLVNRKRSDDGDAPLKTKAMRDRETDLKRQKYPKTLVRVKFRDESILEATFFSSEKISQLYDLVKTSLQTSDRPFYLYVSPPLIQLDNLDKTFWEYSLAPASMVYFKWKGGDPADKSSVLSDEYVCKMEDHPTVVAAASSSASSSSENLPAAATDVGMDDAGGMAGSSGSKRQVAAVGGAPSSGDGSAGTDARKIPKWFKMNSKK